MVDFTGGFNFDPALLANLATQQPAAAPTTVQTSLADVSLGAPSGLRGESFADIDALIKSRTKPALQILTAGSEEAERLSRLGQAEAVQPLEQFADLAAFEEQQSLLGTRGEAAQEVAISGIPVSEFDRELQRRQQETLLRRAGVAGERGGGATILAGQQLAGGQQAEVIQRRLAELEPLVATARGVRSTISGIEEAARARQAQLQSSLGPQRANIRFGTTAPVIESTLQRAQLAGLKDIASATQSGQITQQLASLAGQFAPQIGSFVSSFGTQPTAALQTGTTQAFIPEAGTVAIA